MMACIRNKKNIVLKWLRSLDADTTLNFPIHYMSKEKWFEKFDCDHQQSYSTPLFASNQQFCTQLNKIIDQGLFPSLTRHESRKDQYKVVYGLRLAENPKRFLLNFALQDTSASFISDNEVSDSSTSSSGEKICLVQQNMFLYTYSLC